MAAERNKDKAEGGTWRGRRPKGQQDTHSFSAFLLNTPKGVLAAHLARHHRGLGT